MRIMLRRFEPPTGRVYLVSRDELKDLDPPLFTFARGEQDVRLHVRVKDGKVGRMLKNCTYQSDTPTFWGSLDALGGPDEWRVHGVPSCNKGEPLQVAHVGHGTVPGRFQNVQVGR